MTAAQKHGRVADWWPWHENAASPAAKYGCGNPRIERAKFYVNTYLKSEHKYAAIIYDIYKETVKNPSRQRLS